MVLIPFLEHPGALMSICMTSALAVVISDLILLLLFLPRTLMRCMILTAYYSRPSHVV